MRKYLILSLFFSTLSFAYESVSFIEDPETHPDLENLSVKLQMLDGTQEQTLGKRFIKSSYKRGDKKMDIWCSEGLKGMATDNYASIGLDCRQQRGFGEDNAEHFDLYFSQKYEKSEEDAYTSKGVEATFYYSGDQTQFTDEEIATVFGEGYDERKYSAKKLTKSEESGIEKNPFQLAENINQNLRTLIGTRVKIENGELESRGPINLLIWRLNSKSELSLDIHLGDGDEGRDGIIRKTLKAVSILKTPNDLSSGYDFALTLSRIKEQLEILSE